VSESPYVFIFSSLLSLFIFFFSFARDYLETRVYMARLTYSTLLLTILCCYSVLPHFFFMSCSHLTSLLCFNLLWDTIFRTATPCTHQILCGQHDRVCDAVYFDHHQHSGPLFTHYDLRTDTKSRTHCAGVSESTRGYLPT
jgi:hypothetical protein